MINDNYDFIKLIKIFIEIYYNNNNNNNNNFIFSILNNYSNLENVYYYIAYTYIYMQYINKTDINIKNILFNINYYKNIENIKNNFINNIDNDNDKKKFTNYLNKFEIIKN